MIKNNELHKQVDQMTRMTFLTGILSADLEKLYAGLSIGGLFCGLYFLEWPMKLWL